jgi:predicted HTH transcriptional regulator
MQSSRQCTTRIGSLDEGLDEIIQENGRHTAADLASQLGASEATEQRGVETVIQQDPTHHGRKRRPTA